MVSIMSAFNVWPSIYPASAIREDGWRTLQSIQRDAFSDGLNRSQDEIDVLVEWNDPERYYRSHVDPNSEVGKRFNPDQSYSFDRVAVAATIDGGAIGFAYAANNVSGATEAERTAKRLSVVKNYLWIREIAVNPKYQRRGIGKMLGRMVLENAKDRQPVTAYIWPDEISFLEDVLTKLGFSTTGEQDVRVFGENSEPIRQVRMQASSVHDLKARLSN